MLRRGFLRFLLSAPVAAPAAAANVASGLVDSSAEGPLSIECDGPDELWRATQALRAVVYQDSYQMGPPFEEMKSWSKAFKGHVFKQDESKRRALRNRLDEAIRKKDIPSLVSLAKEVGVDPIRIMKLL